MFSVQVLLALWGCHTWICFQSRPYTAALCFVSVPHYRVAGIGLVILTSTLWKQRISLAGFFFFFLSQKCCSSLKMLSWFFIYWVIFQAFWPYNFCSFVMSSNLLTCLLKGFILFHSSLNLFVQISRMGLMQTLKDEINCVPVDFWLEGITLTHYKMCCYKRLEMQIWNNSHKLRMVFLVVIAKQMTKGVFCSWRTVIVIVMERELIGRA